MSDNQKWYLEPCPFCGSKAEIFHNNKECGIMCSNPDCNVSPYTSTQINEKIATKIWNNRTEK